MESRPPGHAAPPLRRPGALQQRALPGGDLPGPGVALRGGRGALRLRVGAQLPPRLPEARRLRQALRRRAHPGAHRHRHPAGARRRLPRLRHRAGLRRPHRLPPREPDPPLHPHPAPPSATPCSSKRFASGASTGSDHRLRHPAEDGRGRGRGPAARRAAGLRLPRRPGGRRADPGAGLVPGVDGRGGGRHHRLRHGDRQGGHPQGGPLQPAQEPGEPGAGDRPRRPRRAAGALRDPDLHRRPPGPPELRLRRHAGPRSRAQPPRRAREVRGKP